MYLIKIQNTNIMKYFYNLEYLFSLWIYFKVQCIPLVSHDPSEIIIKCWFAAQDTFIIIINVKNGCAA